ncbi:hypothetical protein Ocin01_01600 [Orchesella cincta]|uniref:Uncharacterized protein n=1 Tax=Orchesella cincta TaxID=48709 RepID=A0A1D2NIP5_ORCCI|nr:hypothetical protein Ocin01_01600 [Orchesella cincta]
MSIGTNNQRCLDKCQPNVSVTIENGIGELLPKSSGKPCGPGNCSDDEICVSWLKQVNHRRRESPMMVHECLPNDGNHYNKMNPTGAKLCENGKTHSVLKDSQSCLNEQPPCDLTWKYVCIDEKDSPHNCKLKKCPYSACIENIYCGLEPPCYMEAVCAPDFFLDHLLPNENVYK